MHYSYTVNYAYEFQDEKLVHRPAKPKMDWKPPKPKAALHRRALDPEDLTRRLQIVVAERQAHDDKKRKSRVIAASSKAFRSSKTDEEKAQRRRTIAIDAKEKRKSRVLDPHADNSLTGRLRQRASRAAMEDQLPADPAATDGPYVPQVAASQFTSTTLGESPPDKSNIHRLSRAALKYHMDGLNANPHVAATAGSDIAPVEQAVALRRAQTLRERNYDRNQFQASAIPSSMPENLDPVILSPALRRRSIYAAQSSEDRQQRASRRKSTGSTLGADSSRYSIFLPPLNSTDLATVADAHRVDWTQSDERTSRPKTPPRRPKSASPAHSTKGESKWSFRGRLNSFHKSKGEKSPSPPVEHEEMPKSPMASLFARFKR